MTELNAGYAWTAGAVIFTLADLTRFLAALLRGHLLPPALQKQLLTAAPGSSYGLGIVRWTLPDGTNVWDHNGMIRGSFTIAAGTRSQPLLSRR